MSNLGVLNLRCPACGGPFLSLPQQSGAFVTCPHCAQSAPMAAFTSSQPTASAATALPMRRRVARQPDFTPAWAQSASALQPVSLHPQQYPQQPQPQQYLQQPQQRHPSWPAAPEMQPLFTPTSAGHFPPAPEAAPAWTPAGFPASPQMPPPAGLFGIAEQQPQPAMMPQPSYAPVYKAPPPAPIDFASMRESPTMIEAEMENWQPPKQGTSVFWPLTFLLLVVGACVWVLREDLFPPIIVEIPAGKSAPVVPANPPVAAKQEVAPATPMKAEPEPEIRRAELVKPAINLVAAGEAGQKLFLDIIEAKTPEARAALIAQPEEHGADVEEFFAAAKVELLAFKPSNATPLTLPGQDPVPLFQVTTKANNHGALLRVVPQTDGTFLLDWPLFAETHQRKLASFLEKKPAEPAWFHLGLRRSHGLELPQTSREIHHSFKLQSSADDSLTCLGIVQKDTPIGRYLGRETEWNDIYLARLLLQQRKLPDGTDAVFILDCEGAAKADLQ